MSRVISNPQESRSGSTCDDATHVRAAMSGDGEAYARLVKTHQQRIAATMWRFTRDQGERDGLVQDVFVEAYLSLRTLKDQNRFGSWLRVVAVRVGYRFWKERDRDRKRTPGFVGDWNAIASTAANAESEIDAADSAEWVHRILDELPPRDRLVLTLMYLEELSIPEIAERTEWSRSMVKVQAHRARKKLKKLIEHLPGGEMLGRGVR